MSAAVIAAALVVGGVASADMSRGVISAFRNQLVISKDELPTGKNDKDTVAKINGAKVSELSGEAKSDVMVWSFHYTAFLSKTGATSLKLDFLTDDKERRLSADKKIEGVDPKSTVLSGDITIDEDEGLAKGKTYLVQLSSGNTVVAKATVKFK